jgi:hypothetical protein
MRVPGQKFFVPAIVFFFAGSTRRVRRGCKGLKPQQHTQGPLLHTRESFTDDLIPLLDCFWQIA